MPLACDGWGVGCYAGFHGDLNTFRIKTRPYPQLSNLSDAAEAALLALVAITNIVETGEEFRAVTHFKITQCDFNMERVNLKRHHHVSHHFMY